MRFTPNHIRALALWAEQLGLTTQMQALLALHHHMTVTKTVTAEEINATAMCAITVIGSTEKDRAMFYRAMREWGVSV